MVTFWSRRKATHRVWIDADRLAFFGCEDACTLALALIVLAVRSVEHAAARLAG